MMNWKGYERKRSVLFFQDDDGICLEELRKTTKTLRQDGRSPSLDLNPVTSLTRSRSAKDLAATFSTIGLTPTRVLTICTQFRRAVCLCQSNVKCKPSVTLTWAVVTWLPYRWQVFQDCIRNTKYISSSNSIPNMMSVRWKSLRCANGQYVIHFSPWHTRLSENDFDFCNETHSNHCDPSYRALAGLC
jgi:hypothetical protein